MLGENDRPIPFRENTEKLDSIAWRQFVEGEANAGKAAWQCVLGNMYLDGVGVEFDLTKAKTLFINSANSNYANAHLQLGWIYQYLETKIDAALATYKQALETDMSAAAKARIAHIYLRSGSDIQGMTENARISTGKALFKEAADEKDMYATCEVGVFCLYGLHGFQRNVQQAQTYFKNKKFRVDEHFIWNAFKDVEEHLGMLYLGKGDENGAHELLGKAAQDGNASAAMYLATAYYNGNGVPKDDNKAEEFYKSALFICQHRQGRVVNWKQKVSPQMLFYLGFLSEKGFGGVRKSIEEAKNYYNQAADGGNVSAHWYLANITENSREKFAHNKLAADKGLPEAQYDVAEAYLGGVGVVLNQSKAIAYFKQAAGQGYVPAHARLNNLGIETPVINQGDGQLPHGNQTQLAINASIMRARWEQPVPHAGSSSGSSDRDTIDLPQSPLDPVIEQMQAASRLNMGVLQSEFEARVSQPPPFFSFQNLSNLSNLPTLPLRFALFGSGTGTENTPAITNRPAITQEGSSSSEQQYLLGERRAPSINEGEREKEREKEKEQDDDIRMFNS